MKPFHCGSEQPEVPASNHSLSPELGSENVAQTNEQKDERVAQAGFLVVLNHNALLDLGNQCT